MTKTWCVGGKHYIESINQNMFEKPKPKTEKHVKGRKSTCNMCGRNKSQTFTGYLTKGEDLVKKEKRKVNHCSTMSNSASCDLNSKGDILKLHDKCPNRKCNCQKIITFTPRQHMLEGGSKKRKLQKIFRRT